MHLGLPYKQASEEHGCRLSINRSAVWLCCLGSLCPVSVPSAMAVAQRRAGIFLKGWGFLKSWGFSKGVLGFCNSQRLAQLVVVRLSLHMLFESRQSNIYCSCLVRRGCCSQPSVCSFPATPHQTEHAGSVCCLWALGFWWHAVGSVPGQGPTAGPGLNDFMTILTSSSQFRAQPL